MKAPNGFVFEKRQYGPDFTDEENAALKSCIYKYNEDIICFKEVPKQSVSQLHIFFERIKEETKDLEAYFVLVDLTEATPPPSDVRQFLSKKFSDLAPNLKYSGVFTGKFFLMNIAAKFVLSGALGDKFSVHKTKEEALSAIKNAKRNI